MSKWVNKTGLNLRAVLLCFVMATAFWFLQAMSRSYNSSIAFPLKIETGKDYMFIGEPQNTVLINISENGWRLFIKNLGYGVDELRVHAGKLSNLQSISGSELERLLTDQVDFKVNFVVNHDIDVNLDEIGQKQVQVLLDSSIMSPDNRIKGEYSIRPAILNVTGATSVTDRLDDTLFLRIKALSEGQNLNDFKININDELPDFVEAIPNELVVNVQLEKKQIKTSYLMLDKRGLPKGVDAPDSIKVSLKAFDINTIKKQARIKVSVKKDSFDALDSTVVLNYTHVPKQVQLTGPVKLKLRANE